MDLENDLLRRTEYKTNFDSLDEDGDEVLEGVFPESELISISDLEHF